MAIQWLTDLADMLLPADEASPSALRAFRLRVSLVACAAFVLNCVVILPALFVGLPLIGRVAWANEEDAHMSEKVSAAVAPVQRDIAELARKVDAQTSATNALLAEFSYRDVLQLLRRRCASTDERERDRLYKEIQAAQQRYRNHSGDLTFSAPRCVDL